MPSSNDFLKDAANEHAVYLRGYSNRMAEEVASLIEASEADLITQLFRLEKKLTSRPLTEQRLRDLLASSSEANAKAYAAYYQFLLDHGRELSTIESAAVARDIATATRTPVDNVLFTLSAISKKNKERMVWVDVAAFDPVWMENKDFYVGAGGEGGIRNRYKAFQEYLSKNPSIQVSEVYVREDGSVGFNNGRHRYAVLRDGGAKKIPVAMDSESIKRAVAKGYLTSPPDPVTGELTVSLGSALASPELIFAAVNTSPFEGKLLKDWVDGMADARLERIQMAIRMGIAQGESIEDIVRRLKGTRAMNYTDGLLDISRRSARSMAITYVSHVSNRARQEVYNTNETLIKGVEWVSTLDGRTSSICQARDGEVFPISSGPRPPAHIRCRSTTVPVLKSWKELGIDMSEVPDSTRASMDGQVSSRETYQTWLKKKPESFQDHVLGKTKAELFRSGQLTLDKFVDLNGHALTLEQLKAK